MRKKTMSILEVKDAVAALKGKLIDIRINKGRKKIVTHEGEVIDTFPSVFTMKINDEDGSVLSCSYSDVICGMVSLSGK
jgi:uncharacterized protein Veg